MPTPVDDTFIPVWLAVVGGIPSTIIAIATLVKTIKAAQAERVRKHRVRRAASRNAKTAAAIKRSGAKVPHYEAPTTPAPVAVTAENGRPAT